MPAGTTPPGRPNWWSGSDWAACLAATPNNCPAASSNGSRSAARLAVKPLLVLADEPTGNLDEATADEVLALTCDLVSRTGCGFLMVTHSARLAATLDRRVNLSAGRIA